MSKLIKNISVLLVLLGLFTFSGEVNELQAAKKKPTFMQKTTRTIKRKIKKNVKKTKRAVAKAGANAQNAVMDSAVNAKKALTGKKTSTFVKGHYKKGNKKLTKGHFRQVKQSKKR